MDLIGVGLYTVPDASRLTGFSTGRIRRWLRGYDYKTSGGRRHSSPPVWRSELPEIDGAMGLSFGDLMDVLVVGQLRDRGVSWKAIRMAAENAADEFGTDHPFSVARFKTDGRGVFVDIVRQGIRERALVDLSKNQAAFRKVVSPFLKDVDFRKGGEASVWWPLGRRRSLLVDPARSFGAPVEKTKGVPARVLAQAAGVEKSVDVVARWYGVPARSVRDSVDLLVA